MIYLIGGPPRCGKTTLAKKMSKRFGTPWISCDTLEAISKFYTPKEDWQQKYPYSFLRNQSGMRDNDWFYGKYSTAKIISVLKNQAKMVFGAIEMVVACELADGNDYIIEGYHLVPNFAKKMIKKYGSQNVKAIFLTKFDANKFARDVRQSTTPNDWLLVLTKKDETFVKVGKMVASYSRYFDKEAKKHGLKVFNMDNNFVNKIIEIVSLVR